MNYMTKKGAEELLYRIQMHWMVKGYRIQGHVTARSSSSDDKEQSYIVRTDLLNGLPRQKPVDVSASPMQ